MSCNVSSELVTVAVFNTSADAELVRGQLTAANIESQLTTVDDDGAAGQVHVQVAQVDFERAMRLMFPVADRTRAPAKEIGSWNCPKCGQVVFDFSSVCWLCGTSREGVPPTPPAPSPLAPTPLTPTPLAPTPLAPTPLAPETPASESPTPGTGSPEIAVDGALASMVTPSLPPAPSASAAAPPPDSAAAAPRTLRFARLPLPPPGMVPDAGPPPAPGGLPKLVPAAMPRFSRFKPPDDSPVESPAESPETKLTGNTGPSAATGPSVDSGAATGLGEPAGMAAPVEPTVEPAAVAATVAATPLTSRFVTPVGPAPQVRARVDAKQKEIESMTRWAWWTAVVGVLVCPATVYSIWLLLTLTFAAARPSRAGRLRFVGAWCLNAAVIVVWYILLQVRM